MPGLSAKSMSDLADFSDVQGLDGSDTRYL
jgi:hypothetical protein